MLREVSGIGRSLNVSASPASSPDASAQSVNLAVRPMEGESARRCRSVRELDRAARAVFQKANLEHLFIHALGHGIGLKTHEFPRIKQDGKDKETVLKKGMIFTLEPGLYLPGKGGVRYEDTILITENGYINFY